MYQKYNFSEFKTKINIAEFSTTFGYKIDRKKSTRTSIAMKSCNDKIIVSRKGGIWVYFSVVNDQDSGTIIDFVANRTGSSMADIGKRLADWSGITVHHRQLPIAQSPTHDPSRVKTIFAKCKPITKSEYLESRGLTEQLLRSKRFAGRIYEDSYRNLAFPHFRNREICGLELKNANRGMLVRGSQKTFWRSNASHSDDTLVIAESVIDALSYQQIHSMENAIFLATGGGVSNHQCKILCEMIDAAPSLMTVILATDNDDGGKRISNRISEAIQASSFSGEVQTHTPSKPGQDWNDALNVAPTPLSQSWDAAVSPIPR